MPRFSTARRPLYAAPAIRRVAAAIAVTAGLVGLPASAADAFPMDANCGLFVRTAQSENLSYVRAVADGRWSSALYYLDMYQTSMIRYHNCALDGSI